MPTQIVNFGSPTTGPAGTEQCQEVRVYVNRTQAQDDVRLKVTSGTICNVTPAPATVMGATLADGCYTETTPGAGFVLGFGTASTYSFEAQEGAQFAFADSLAAPAFEDYWWDVDSWTAEEASSRVKGDPQESFVLMDVSGLGNVANATADQGVLTAEFGTASITVTHQQRTPGQVKDDVTVTVAAPATITELDPARGIWQLCRNEASGGTVTSTMTATNAVDGSQATAPGVFEFIGAAVPDVLVCGPQQPGRHSAFIGFDNENEPVPNDHYAGHLFHLDIAPTATGPWTPAEIVVGQNDCTGDTTGDFQTGGGEPEVGVSFLGLEPSTPYFVRLQHIQKPDGSPGDIEEVICGPITTLALPDPACATASGITQTGMTLTVPDSTSGAGYGQNNCFADTVTIEYGTTPGGPYPLSETYTFPVTTTSGLLAPPPFELTGLTPETPYYYRTTIGNPTSGDPFHVGPECSAQTLAEPNVGPTITGLDDQSGTVNTALSDQFQVADSDGTVVSVTSAPAGATLVDDGAGNWTISYTPTAVGDTTFTVTVTDDAGATASDTITFTGVEVTTPANPFQPLPCADDDPVDPGAGAALTRDVEGTLLCDIDANGDVVGTALVEGVYDENGVRTGTRTVDPVTGAAYTPTGTLQPCIGNAGVDIETITLCDVQPNGAVVPFQVVTVYDATDGSFVSERRVGPGGNPYTAQGNVSICNDPEIGWESICYTTTATGDEVLPGTKRHDDNLPSQGIPAGFLVFSATGQRVDDQPGYQQVNCDTCCAVPFGEGCWANATGNGTWTTLREADGTIIGPLDTLTGNPVAAGDIGDCPAATITTAPVNVRSHMLNLAAGQSWTQANLAGEAALSVGFTVISGTANLTDSDATPTTLLPAGFSALWAVNEDANTLFAPQSIAAVGGRTVVVWTSRA